MVWVVEKKVFYHILDLGFESVGIPVRVKFEFEVNEGIYVADSLSVESLYNKQAVINRYPGVKLAILEQEIEKTVRCEIRNHLKNCHYILGGAEEND